MPTTTIVLDLPTPKEITEGLTLEECYPPLEAARQAAGEAEGQLEEAKRAATDREAEIAGARVAGTSEDHLAELLRHRDAARMMVEDSEGELSEARAAVEQETAAGRRAMGEAIDERLAELQELADELAAPLLELRARFDALRAHVRRQDRDADLSAGQGPRWPLSPIALRFLRVPSHNVDWLPPEQRADHDAAVRELAGMSIRSTPRSGPAETAPSDGGQNEDDAAMIRRGMAGLEAAERSGRLG